ncbi:MAG: hypothetical protein N2559_15915, partial [Anaerolineae bacterium]|nr:hypothetical protein [Anaerolineae bacterium]
VSGWMMIVRRVFVPTIIFVSLLTIFVLPFFLWDTDAFIEDVFRYPAGSSAHLHPIRSVGFSGLALSFGWISQHQASFPFERLQMLFGIPTLIVLLCFLSVQPSMTRFWLCSAILTLVVGFLGRVFNDNHLGYVLSLALLGIFTKET